jgi:hypothetical protein
VKSSEIGIREVRGAFIAECDFTCDRPLRLGVDTRQHAKNLLAKHLREYHPGVETPTDESEPSALVVVPAVVNLTAAARAVIDTDSITALTVWCALTDTEPTEARAMIAALAERDGTVKAHVAPF